MYNPQIKEDIKINTFLNVYNVAPIIVNKFEGLQLSHAFSGEKNLIKSVNVLYKCLYNAHFLICFIVSDL